jgi:hypothetical protein
MCTVKKLLRIVTSAGGQPRPQPAGQDKDSSRVVAIHF